MSYIVKIECLTSEQLEEREYESLSPHYILESFDAIDFEDQALLTSQCLNDGDVFFFKIQQLHSERLIGGVLSSNSPHHYYFKAHAELFNKIEKNYLFGLLKKKALPVYTNAYLPLHEFRQSLQFFLQGEDEAITQLFAQDYSNLFNPYSQFPHQ